MQQLTEKQALEILKSVLDKATKDGVFHTINDVYTIVMAFDIIAKKVNSENENDAVG